MKRNNIIYFILSLLFFFKLSFADDFNLKLKSKVEVRNWKLSSKAYKQETFIKGASIELYNASSIISKTISDKDGNFEINIPSSGNYTLVITSLGYDPKKFSITAKSIPIGNNSANFIPSVDMTSFIATKIIKGVGDLGLNQPIIHAERRTDKNEYIRYSGLKLSVNINDAEYHVIQRFCICNKLGDVAIEDKNYALAKTYYSMATDIIPGESYPKEQLKKTEDGLKLESFKSRKETAKKTKSKSKTEVSKQTIVGKPTKNTDFKNSADGKATHKTRHTLGK